MSEKSVALKARTEAFAIASIRFCHTLPNSLAGRRISQQLIDASTSVAANYRAACRAYTDKLFVSKLSIVDEEADETEFWFRVIRKLGCKRQTPSASSNKRLTNSRVYLPPRFAQLGKTSASGEPRNRGPAVARMPRTF